MASPTAAFSKALRSFETGGFTADDLVSELESILESGAAPGGMVDELRLREEIEPLPKALHARIASILNAARARAGESVAEPDVEHEPTAEVEPAADREPTALPPAEPAAPARSATLPTAAPLPIVEPPPPPPPPAPPAPPAPPPPAPPLASAPLPPAFPPVKISHRTVVEDGFVPAYLREVPPDSIETDAAAPPLPAPPLPAPPAQRITPVDTTQSEPPYDPTIPDAQLGISTGKDASSQQPRAPGALQNAIRGGARAAAEAGQRLADGTGMLLNSAADALQIARTRAAERVARKKADAAAAAEASAIAAKQVADAAAAKAMVAAEQKRIDEAAVAEAAALERRRVEAAAVEARAAEKSAAEQRRVEEAAALERRKVEQVAEQRRAEEAAQEERRQQQVAAQRRRAEEAAAAEAAAAERRKVEQAAAERRKAEEVAAEERRQQLVAAEHRRAADAAAEQRKLDQALAEQRRVTEAEPMIHAAPRFVEVEESQHDDYPQVPMYADTAAGAAPDVDAYALDAAIDVAQEQAAFADTVTLRRAPPPGALRRRIGLGVAILLLVAGVIWLANRIPTVGKPAPLPTATAAPPAAGTILRDCPTCMAMSVLSAAQFKQGSLVNDGNASAFEKPQHWVIIGSAFAMAVNPVTVDEFREFVEATKRDMQGCDTYDGVWTHRTEDDWHSPGFQQTGAHPVTCVSWVDADAFAQWYSTKTGHHYRLPTASEWEYAARAGGDSVQHWGVKGANACAFANVADLSAAHRYPGFASFPCSDGYVNTSPVGSFKPNAFGLDDMLGNVFQWTLDCWHPDYRGAPVDGSARLDGDCSERELRGGSWFTKPAFVRANYRNHFATDYRASSVGFRLVRDLSP